ncbi:hypothetical protein ACS6ZF_06170 [Streptococcus suis]|nr:hypothetical protein [Streptococcus suis]
MDQEKTTHSLALKGKIAVENVIAALYTVAKALHDNRQYKMEHRTFEGDTRFNDSMATASEKDMERLLHSEVHLEKLKHYLEEHKVGFTYYQKEEETLLFFETKNRLLVEKALKQMISDITKDPKATETFANHILRKPHEMTPEEKIAYYKTHTVYTGLTPVVTKDLGKEKER